MAKMSKQKPEAGTDAGIHRRIFAKLIKNNKAQEVYEAEDAMFSFIEKVKAEMVKKHLTEGVHFLLEFGQDEMQKAGRTKNSS